MAGGKFVKMLAETVQKSGLDMSEAARMQRARDLGYDTDFPITHGSPNESLSEIKKGGIGNIFDGLFALSGDTGAGKYHHTFYPRVGKVAEKGDTDFDYDKTMAFLKNKYPNATDDELEGIYKISAEDKDVFNMDENPLANYGFDDLGEASWEGQRLRGQIAALHDFDAVKMSDEFGTSYLIPHGTKARKSTAAFDPAQKESSNLMASALPFATVGGVGLASTLSNDAQAAQGNVGSIQAPSKPGYLTLAQKAAAYNRMREERLHPLLNMALPVGELPEDLLRKLAYGDDITAKDRIMAALGLL